MSDKNETHEHVLEDGTVLEHTHGEQEHVHTHNGTFFFFFFFFLFVAVCFIVELFLVDF